MLHIDTYLVTMGLLGSLATPDDSMAAGSADIRPPLFVSGAASCLKFDIFVRLEDRMNQLDS